MSILTHPKSFARDGKGVLLELETDPPFRTRPDLQSVRMIEREKGYRIRLVKVNKQFYIYKVR